MKIGNTMKKILMSLVVIFSFTGTVVALPLNQFLSQSEKDPLLGYGIKSIQYKLQILEKCR